MERDDNSCQSQPKYSLHFNASTGDGDGSTVCNEKLWAESPLKLSLRSEISRSSAITSSRWRNSIGRSSQEKIFARSIGGFSDLKSLVPNASAAASKGSTISRCTFALSSTAG